MVDQVTQCLSRVEDIIDQQYMPAFHVGRQLRVNMQVARRPRGAAVTRGLNQAKAERQVKVANQVGQKHQAAIEHADEGDRTLLIVPAYLPGQLSNTILDARGWDEDFHETWPASAPAIGGKDVLNTKASPVKREFSAWFRNHCYRVRPWLRLRVSLARINQS